MLFMANFSIKFDTNGFHSKHVGFETTVINAEADCLWGGQRNNYLEYSFFR